MLDHAVSFGGEFLEKSVKTVDFSKKPFEVISSDNQKHLARSVIVATGAETRWLNVPGEEKLRGRGVSSCAPCDAPFFKEKNVVVIGGGDSAMEEALVLTKYATVVTIIHRRDKFRASAAMQERVREMTKEGRIKILWNTEVVEFLGEQQLARIKVKNTQTGQIEEMDFDGAFVAIGHTPSTKIFKGQLKLDEKGYVVVKDHTQTDIEGVFVAGDVHDHTFKQAITAAGFGCMAALETLKHLDKNSS